MVKRVMQNKIQFYAKCFAKLYLRPITDVTLKCDYLVMCENSKTIGPSKLAKAQSLGVKLIYENQFFHLIETWELPE